MNICLSLQCKSHPLPIYTFFANSTSGTGAHAIKVFNFEGTQLSRVEPYSSFLRGTTPISATAFHPHRMMLACAARGDTHINLFTCAEKKAGGENRDKD